MHTEGCHVWTGLMLEQAKSCWKLERGWLCPLNYKRMHFYEYTVILWKNRFYCSVFQCVYYILRLNKKTEFLLFGFPSFYYVLAILGYKYIIFKQWYFGVLIAESKVKQARLRMRFPQGFLGNRDLGVREYTPWLGTPSFTSQNRVWVPKHPCRRLLSIFLWEWAPTKHAHTEARCGHQWFLQLALFSDPYWSPVK